MKGCQVPPKAKSVKIGAPIVRAPQLSESGSPQGPNLMSTDNNKGGSVVIPPKPTINLVPKKDIPGGDAPPGRTQRTIIRPVRHIVLNS